MVKPLVIVESPTKARTIEKFLGKDYEVLASYGHVRDLPTSASEIPAAVKKEEWSRIGIDIQHDFEPLYIIPGEKKERVQDLKKAMKDASELLLATDEDREGESISWHLLEILKPKIPVKRLVFHEITKEAIKHALSHTREIDQSLVKAQETRRIVDRLFGYTVSPLLWKKMAPGLSAGRVQSVAMRLLAERERERMRFKRATFWDLSALFSKQGNETKFGGVLTHVGGKRVAQGKDFLPETGTLDPKSGAVALNEKDALALREKVLSEKALVSNVEEKPFTSKPSAPFTTSTLQQEGSAKLSFAARRTMQVAQMLYENGFITYMRTDSTTLSEEALGAARNLITREYGKEYLYPETRIYKTKVKNAQEAHEAIRPAGSDFVHPNEVKEKLGFDAFRLYDLIWKRTVASQMRDAEGTRMTVTIEAGPAQFRASGKTIQFPGFLRAYVEGSVDPDAELADEEKILPPLTTGEQVTLNELNALSHETQPPARFTEGTLIKELERLGIGRPSTWATIVDVVLKREYAFKKGTALVPSFLALALTTLMRDHFQHLLDYEFTARLEDDLDAISRGEADNLAYLKKFYFGNGHAGLETLVKLGGEQIDPKIVCGIPYGNLSDGRPYEVRIGRYGPFIADGTNRASVPEGLAPDELSPEIAEKLLADAARGPQSVGTDPQTNKPIYLKSGRFGPYVQLGDMIPDGEKPKMVSLLPGQKLENITFEIALKLLEFPKNLGPHPTTGQEIIVANGRYGPYIKSGTDTRSIPLEEISPLDVTIEKAVEILARPKTRGRAGATPKALKEVGKHPVTGVTITLRSGRYGPYVTDGKLNASLQRGSDPEKLTIEEAVSLLEARASAPPREPRAKRGRGGKAAKASAGEAPPKKKGKKTAKKVVEEAQE